jgi:soluble lytic murein transglycosylase-like protein
MMKTRVIATVVLLLSLAAGALAQGRNQQSIQRRALEIEPAIVEASKRYQIDARLLRSICFAESRFQINAVSPKGALGPMQFMPETAARYGLTNPFNPRTAIDAAARYLRDLLARFNGRIDLAVAAYNAGEGVVESFKSGRPLLLRSGKIINPRGRVTGGIPPYPETRAYVRNVILPLSEAQPNKSGRAPSSLETNRARLGSREKDSLKSTSFIEIE